MQTVASIESDEFAVEPRPMEFRELLEAAEAFAGTLPGDHPLTVVPAQARVLADPARIGQVLRNLLGNAAKYSCPGTPIELRAKREGGRVRIEVADRGMGIQPDELDRIFEKFARGRRVAGREVAGAGLGLYLSRRIVREHGAELVVSSTPGEGSVFGFELEAAG